MAKDLNQDVREAVSTAGQGFSTEKAQPKTKTKKSNGSAIATVDETMQSKAASSATQLAEIDKAAKSAVVKKSFQKGQDLAKTETLAETAGYLGAKAQLTAMATSQRVKGVDQIQLDSDKAIAAEIVDLEVKGAEEDPLDLLSGFTGNNHGLLLPSPFA